MANPSSPAPVDKIDSYLLIIHLVIAAFFPTASLIKSLFISMNIFSLICTGRNEIAPYPGAISLYGAPILYLIIQSMFLFFVLVMWDSGSALGGLFRRKTFRERDAEEKETPDNEIMEELSRVDTSTEDRLKVIHLTKAYGKLVAVEDVSFGVKRGECFALLGPNGAGKSTIISVIRGDLRPSNRDGEVLVENLSMTKRRAVARQVSLTFLPLVRLC
jgi:ABC-type transport system involved in cytochrome bd biosynthesis fused ATPase/permease subunit